MAFRRTNTNLPKDVEFPADLAKLGFKIAIGGCVVDNNNPKNFFEFEKYEKYETNQRRYNAMHKAVRREVHEVLACMGVAPVYIDQLDDKRSHHVSGKKPKTPSMKILASPGFSPFEHKELYLIIGDSKQDLGIWSRKTVLTEGGLNNGSATGLIAALRDVVQPISSNKSPIAKDKESDLPSVIILNPGELLYSHKDKDNMSAATWHDRQREHAFADQYKITERYNLLPGHQTSSQHVKLCLRGFLKPTIGYRTRMNIITIGDASEAVLECLNEDFNRAAARDDLIVAKVTIAMIQPSHNANIVTAPALQDLLATHGRIWEAHSSPKGTLLADVVGAGTSNNPGSIVGRQIESAVPDPDTKLVLTEPVEDAAPETNLAPVHVLPTGDIGSAGEDSTLASHCDPITAEWIKNGSFSESKNYKTTDTAPATQLALCNSKQIEEAAQGNTAHTGINRWIDRVESFVGGVNANTALATKPSSFEDMKGDGQKSASPLAPESHLGPVYNKANEIESDGTPHEVYSTWDTGSGLAMAATKKAPTVTGPASSEDLATSKEDVAVDEHGPDVEPLTIKKTSVAVAEHTASKEPVTVIKARPHNRLEIGENGITLTSAPTHAMSRPIPIPPRIKAPTTDIADSDKQVAVADAKKADNNDDSHAYPYHEAPVNCPTYSAGIEDTTEMIFPAVMRDVVGFFQEQKKRWG
jgi:hypothetical protein